MVVAATRWPTVPLPWLARTSPPKELLHSEAMQLHPALHWARRHSLERRLHHSLSVVWLPQVLRERWVERPQGGPRFRKRSADC